MWPTLGWLFLLVFAAGGLYYGYKAVRKFIDSEDAPRRKRRW